VQQARAIATARMGIKAVSARVTVKAVSAVRIASANIAKQVKEAVTA